MERGKTWPAEAQMSTSKKLYLAIKSELFPHPYFRLIAKFAKQGLLLLYVKVVSALLLF